MPGVGGMEHNVRDSQGRYCAYLEIYFPYDKFYKWENEAEIKANIKKKIEDAIGQPINQRLYSKPHQDMSSFYEELREKFEPKMKTLGSIFDIDSMIAHGIVFRLRMTAE